MSRSVKPDWNKLFFERKRAERAALSETEVFELMSVGDPEYEQKARKTVVAPTAEDWAKYHLAKRALLTLKAYENTTGAEEVEIPCPKPTTHYEFLETIEEWLDRCRALRAEAEQEAA